jgi:hypothetical protein
MRRRLGEMDRDERKMAAAGVLVGALLVGVVALTWVAVLAAWRVVR